MGEGDLYLHWGGEIYNGEAFLWISETSKKKTKLLELIIEHI